MLPFGDMVRMTAAEHAKLVQRFGSADAARLCEILDDYLVNHPRKRYASHYRAILSWCVTRLQEEKLTAQRMKNAQEAAQRVATGSTGMASGYGEQAMANARRMEELNKKYGGI